MTKLSETELMTPKEKARHEKAQEVIELFKSLAPTYIGKERLKPERVLRLVASKTDLSVLGVKGILKRYGLYESNKALAEQYASN